jgi:hypothetical protein
MLPNAHAIEAHSQWIWNGFTDVDNVEMRNWVLERLEVACQCSDAGLFRRAIYWLASAAEHVFGFYSEEYSQFAYLYPWVDGDDYPARREKYLSQFETAI